MLRRLLILGAMLAMGLAWSAPGGMGSAGVMAQGTACAAATDDEVRAVVDAYTAAFGQRDVDGLMALISPDGQRDDSRDTDEAGTDEVRAGLEKIFATFPDFAITFDLTLIDAPHAALHYTATGTQAETLRGTEPTGEAASWDGIALLTVECGSISNIVSVLDQLAQQNKGTSTPATPVGTDAMASPASCPELTDDAATALMDSWYHEAWAGDTEVLATITTPDVYHHWAMGADSSGQAAQQERLTAAMAIAPGATMDYDSLTVDGDSIAVHWTQTLGDDAWGGVNIFHTECGLIDEVWSEMNIYDLPATDTASPEATPAG